MWGKSLSITTLNVVARRVRGHHRYVGKIRSWAHGLPWPDRLEGTTHMLGRRQSWAQLLPMHDRLEGTQVCGSRDVHGPSLVSLVTTYLVTSRYGDLTDSEGVCGEQDLNAGTAAGPQDSKAKPKQAGGTYGKPARAAGHAPKRRKADVKQSERKQNTTP